MPISRTSPNISPFQPRINEASTRATRNWNPTLDTTFIFWIGKTVDLVPRDKARENRCKIAKESVARLPSLPSQARYTLRKFHVPFPQNPPFLSFFSSQRNEALAPHFSKRSVQKESWSFFRFGQKEKRKKKEKKKMSSLTHVHRTFHNYDGLQRCETRVGAWKKFGTFRFVHNVLAATAIYAINRRRVILFGSKRGGGEEGGRTLISFILARFPSSGYNLITASISNFPHDDKPKSIPVREQ